MKRTPRLIIIGLMALLGLIGLYFIVTQILKIYHPAYPMAQAAIYEFEKSTGSKVTYDSINIRSGALIFKNVYTDLQNPTNKNKTVLYAESIAIQKDLSTQITNISLSRPTPEGPLTIGLRDVRFSNLKIQNGTFYGGRVEFASLFMAGEGALPQVQKIKDTLRVSLGSTRDDLPIYMLDKLPQMGVAFDLYLKNPTEDQWLYRDRWYMVDMFDISNRALIRGITPAFRAWKKDIDPVNPDPFSLEKFIKIDGYALIFKNIGGLKPWLKHFALGAGVPEDQSVPFAIDRMNTMRSNFITANPKLEAQGKAFFDVMQDFVTEKTKVVSLSFEPDPAVPDGPKVFKVMPSLPAPNEK